MNMQLLVSCLILLIWHLRHGTCSCDTKPHVYILPRSPFRYQGESLNMKCIVHAQDGQTLGKGVTKLLTTNVDGNLTECPSVISVQNSTSIILHSTADIIIPTNRKISDIEYICSFEPFECKNTFRDFTLVAIDNYPEAIRNVSCIIYNWQTITCVTDLGQFYRHRLNTNFYGVSIDMKMKDTFVGGPSKSSWIKCPFLSFTNKTVRDAVTCSWDAGQDWAWKPDIYEFWVNVTNLYRKDTVMSSFQTMVSVKPDPVTDVVVKNKNSATTMVLWSHNVFGAVTYEVAIQPWDTSCGSAILQNISTNRTSVIISGLLPFTNYTLFIISYPMINGRRELQHSDPTIVNVTTLADVPEMNPYLNLGSFYLDVNNSGLQISWTPITRCQQNGPGLHYQVTRKFENGTTVEWLAEGFYVDLPPDSNGTIDVRACNTKGCANDQASSLTISNQRPAKPTDVTTTIINDTMVQISWDLNNQSKVTDYTVHWCEINNNQRCAFAIQNRTVYRNESSVYIQLKDPRRSYKFGVSTEAQSDSGPIISSGIMWSTCRNRKYGLPNTTMPTFVNYTENGVILTWHPYSKCNHDYGVANLAKLTIMDASKGNKTEKIVAMASGTYEVKYLPPGRYNWQLQGLFQGNLSRPSRGSAFVIPEVPNYLQYLLLSFGILVFIVLVVVIVSFCKKCRQYLDKVDSDMKQIQTPYIKDLGDSGIGIPGEPLLQPKGAEYTMDTLRDSGISKCKSREDIPLIGIYHTTDKSHSEADADSSTDRDNNTSERHPNVYEDYVTGTQLLNPDKTVYVQSNKEVNSERSDEHNASVDLGPENREGTPETKMLQPEDLSLKESLSISMPVVKETPYISEEKMSNVVLPRPHCIDGSNASPVKPQNEMGDYMTAAI